MFDQTQTNEKGEPQPFIFTPGARQVIGGWEEGILGMKVGGTRRLVLPPVAAYGESGQGSIPPNSVLIFDIQLLEVEQ
jgi:peptidylprolyl isomerase